MFTKKKVTILNKDEFPCKSYTEDQFDNSNFSNCCKTKLWDEIYPRINCTIATMEGISQNQTYIYNNNNNNNNFIINNDNNDITSTNFELNTNINANNVLLEECKVALDAKSVFNDFTQVLETHHLNPQLFGCPVPCRRITYDFDVNYYFDKIQGGNRQYVIY